MSISIKGQSGGTTSGSDGTFSIKVNKGATLIFSIIGYEERQIKIDNDTAALSVGLTSKSTGLNEVVVIGYGTQKIKDVTSAISRYVNLGDERERPIVNIMQELAGRGLQVCRYSSLMGRPGRTSEFAYPGFYTHRQSGNATPVYVVDGILSDIVLPHWM